MDEPKKVLVLHTNVFDQMFETEEVDDDSTLQGYMDMLKLTMRYNVITIDINRAKVLLKALSRYIHCQEASMQIRSYTQMHTCLLYIAEVMGVTVEDMKSKTRKQEVVVARQLFESLLKTKEYGSAAAIGNILNRDHATVLHSDKTIRNYVHTRDKKFYKNIAYVLDFYKVRDEYEERSTEEA